MNTKTIIVICFCIIGVCGTVWTQEYTKDKYNTLLRKIDNELNKNDKRYSPDFLMQKITDKKNNLLIRYMYSRIFIGSAWDYRPIRLNSDKVKKKDLTKEHMIVLVKFVSKKNIDIISSTLKEAAEDPEIKKSDIAKYVNDVTRDYRLKRLHKFITNAEKEKMEISEENCEEVFEAFSIYKTGYKYGEYPEKRKGGVLGPKEPEKMLEIFQLLEMVPPTLNQRTIIILEYRKVLQKLVSTKERTKEEEYALKRMENRKNLRDILREANLTLTAYRADPKEEPKHRKENMKKLVEFADELKRNIKVQENKISPREKAKREAHIKSFTLLTKEERVKFVEFIKKFRDELKAKNDLVLFKKYFFTFPLTSAQLDDPKVQKEAFEFFEANRASWIELCDSLILSENYYKKNKLLFGSRATSVNALCRKADIEKLKVHMVTFMVSNKSGVICVTRSIRKYPTFPFYTWMKDILK